MGDVDKVWAEIGDQPVFVRALSELAPSCSSIVMVTRSDSVERARTILAPLFPGVTVVAGGSERQESVRLGLAALSAEVAYIAVHDSARPFASGAMLDSGIRLLARYHGAVPALTPVDTVKKVNLDGLVVSSLARDELRAVQTPQVFRATSLRAAHQHAVEHGLTGTDDASLLELAGMSVATFSGDPANFKITTSIDLLLARQLAVERSLS
jgi:2-C-methyl-D-erythritol 4-phosphate cytidylyltransferase